MRIISIDVSTVRSTKQLHEILMKQLHFPNFYGKNWDAFWDTITGFVEMPDKIKILGWQALVNTLPQDAQRLLSCLHDYNQEVNSKKTEIILE